MRGPVVVRHGGLGLDGLANGVQLFGNRRIWSESVECLHFNHAIWTISVDLSFMMWQVISHWKPGKLMSRLVQLLLICMVMFVGWTDAALAGQNPFRVEAEPLNMGPETESSLRVIVVVPDG